MAVMKVFPCKPMVSATLINSLKIHAIAHRRGLSATACKHSQSVEADSQALNQLRVNRARLMNDIHYTCQWGQGQRWGK